MAKKKYLLDYRVLNFDWNKNTVIEFNVFDNITVRENAEELLQKYAKGDITFNEFDDKLDQLVKWQEWARCEYEMLISPWPSKEDDEAEKVDCYQQYHMNHTAAAIKVLYDNGLSPEKPKKEY